MLDKRNVNKLVIVGNGFDIANGLKTSYVDFILWYLKKCCTENKATDLYRDRLLKFYDTKFNEENSNILFKDVEDINLFLKTCTKSNITNDIHSKYFSINNFLYLIISDINSKSWVNIESLYFKIISDEIKNNQNDTSKINYTTIQNLNSDLEFLKEQLIQYLNQIDKPKVRNLPFIRQFDRIFKVESHVQSLSKNFYINFNYTDTLKQYTDEGNTILNIHGSLTELDNPIIFGYGDETNKYYKHIEDADEKELMKFFKSFWYSKTDNYSKLLGYLESGDFEVYILGHSCGLSDRVMLKSIFEHTSCKKIHALHYGNSKEEKMQRHFETVIQISRHFDDKVKMRERVQHFDENMFLPQINM